MSVIIVCVMELLQNKFYIFEYLREATISLVETFQKLYFFFPPKNCRYSELLLTLVVQYKTR